MTTPPDYKVIEDEIVRIRKDKELAIEKQNFEQAKRLREQEERPAPAQGGRATSGGAQPSTCSTWSTRRSSPRSWPTGPASVYKLTEEETAKLLRMEDELHKRVIGQEDAIKAVSQAIRRTRAGLKDPKRPSGSFIFLGPSGVGKTELAKTLAEFLFGDEAASSSSTCPSTWRSTPSAGWSAPLRLRRVRGGWPADRGGAAQAVLGGALRRDREGPPRRLQHAAADPRGRPPHRLAGPHGRLQEHRPHHDLQPRHRRPAQGHGRLRQGRRGRHLREDEGEGQRRAEAALPARVPQPHRRDASSSTSSQGRGHRDRRPDDPAGQNQLEARASASS